ncbi:hypothetical protein FQR65_LT13122 [Abscondita terminalis]|nr:hypothetical protein FQR65_LT13122 [Abscondita terminalis]
MFYKTCLIALMALSGSVYIFYTYTAQESFTINVHNASIQSKYVKDTRYLVSSPKCKIPNFDAFNEDVKLLHKPKKYINCTKLPLLSFIVYERNGAVLCINETLISLYSESGVNCCYSYITRYSDSQHNLDKDVRISQCVKFEKNVTLIEDIVLIECKDETDTKIYSNIHAIVKTENKTDNKSKSSDGKISVLIIGIDSVSRLNFIRSLPKTREFLERQNWLELTGYNKVGDNTFPNLMAILTGKNESKAYETCVTGRDSFDNCSMLWYDYRRLGYVTAYVEDDADINTFNYNKKGFKNPPVDYYFRPYMIAVQKFLQTTTIDGMTYCTGPETSGERVIYLVKTFAKTLAKYLYFGIFWMNSFSHNDLNSASRMDAKVYELLDDLVSSQVLNNTIVFFFSDHGLRFGTFRYTTSGWLEERLPFFYIHIPKSFRKTYSLYYNNLQINRDKLTTPYDFYMTLQDILVMTTQKHIASSSNGCPKCHTLFKQIDPDRSCIDANIDQHWCTCLDYRPYPTNLIVHSAVQYVIKSIHQTIKSYGSTKYKKCQTYKYAKLLSSSISNDTYRNSSYLLILFKTKPSAVFEATVSLQEEFNSFRLEGDVSRLDYYQPHSSSFLNCNRPCHDLDWPMICRVKLTIENHKSLQKYHWYSNNCSIQDEITTSVLTVNHQLPGPSIQVCQNDVLVIDVVNKIPGQSVTIHWRGQPQKEAPMMDGVPMVTQCPISSYTTFQYKFRASAPGTHLWHAHSGARFSEGIFGAFIVKEPNKINPLKKLYDFDEKYHVVIISEKNIENSRSLLINGKDVGEEISFFVSWGRRYRFRMMYSGGSVSCPITVSVERHLLNVISLDGNSICPYEVNSVSFSKGERIDFVIKADQKKGSYALKVTSECLNGVSKAEAFIKYDNRVDVSNRLKTTDKLNKILSKGKRFETVTCESKSDKVCLGDVESLSDIPRELTNNVDTKLFLGFDSKIIYHASKENISEDSPEKVYRMNNITFTYPSSPLLTQKEDVLKSSICNSLNKPMNCERSDTCECVHIEKIGLGSKVELIFIDLGMDTSETVFHLHGYKFYVVGYRNFKKPISLDHLKQLDKKGTLFKKNFNKPVLKDTLRIPQYGVVAVRFVADNPGYWILRDEHASQWTRGLDMVFQVGDSCDTVATPKHFPTCGSWTGPDFFLV